MNKSSNKNDVADGSANTVREKEILAVKEFLLGLQENICAELANVDGSTTFNNDSWNRDEGGMGISRVISDGKVIEKGGVNFSHVFGEAMPPSATASRPELAGRKYQAMGVSLVIHPDNPNAPTSHANFRFFVAEPNDKDEEAVWWFGGGYDLTPYYGFEEDCKHWHQQAQIACAAETKNFYSQFKQQCDDYFYIKHRKEPRGVGGLFFDDFNEGSFEQCFELVKQIANSYLRAYTPILEKRKDQEYTIKQKEFQEYRRGRYVEFNLVHDRGTLFGLQSGVGRIESILMSLPPIVRWIYDWNPEPGSEEEKLYTEFLKPKDWV